MSAAERLLLIVEDDDAFARTLVRSFERRGYRVLRATSLDDVRALLAGHTPEFAVV
ncbi:MAG: two-component system response regulator, partial [Burkholderiaceae bacterium]